MSSRTYDIVVIGATGFSGRLLTEYLAKNYGSTTRLAIAGRNLAKLEKVRAEISATVPAAESIPILIADSADAAALTAMAEQTAVVASTVGPYAKYGTPLVEVCARTGTSYCDLTGEADWHALMFNKYEAIARESGARIVHQAGFDSVPSDVGAFLAARTFRERFGRDCEAIEMYVSLRGGGMQGGTIDTVLNELEGSGGDVRKEKKATQAAAPSLPSVGSTNSLITKGVSYSESAGRWAVPFFMAGANQPYVARSNGRLGYSANFTYRESMVVGSLPVALAAYGGMIAGGLCLVAPPTRWLLKRYVLPVPGDGPSLAAQEAASWDMLFCATSGTDQVDIKIDATGDASCISTTCCLAETAMVLSVDAAKLTSTGGVMTSMAAAGQVLVDRLRATPLFVIEEAEIRAKL